MSDIVITEPGIYYDLDEADYHAQHDWLSWSRMKHLLPPSTPAHFKASLKAGEERKRHFDLGKVVHRLILGEGSDFEVVQALNRQKESYDATSYDLVSAQAHRDRIYEAGRVPILRHELDAAEAMAASVQQHGTASALLADGRPEVSLFWIDDETGVKCRARLDWLPNPDIGARRLIVPDVKTAADGSGPAFGKAAASFGYFGQWTHYLDGIRALSINKDPAFVFVIVEKDDPHLVNVGQFVKRDDVAQARRAVDHCRRLYADCLAANQWPGYGEDINDFELPTWWHYRMEALLP